MSFLPGSVIQKKNGVKAKPTKSCYDEIEKTVETIDTLKDSILPYEHLGVKFRAVNVFWTPLENKYLNPSRKGYRPNVDETIGSADDDLTAARPPDGILLPIWRVCHMGIILEAYNESSKDAAQLNIAVELFKDGIHLNHSFGDASTTKKKLIQELRSHYDEDHPVYSAGVKREIDVDLNVLLEVLESFKMSEYGLMGFNCQHFTSITYYRFTGQFLRDLLRRRWTSNHNGWGVRDMSQDESTNEAMVWASPSKFLVEQLQPVEGEAYLFSRSPPGLGKVVKVTAAVALFASKKLPLASAALAVGSIAIDKIPNIRRFERSTIWFKYDIHRKDWFWTPYRDGEVSEEDRWISIHQHRVAHGRFEGRELEGTSRRIASILANNGDLNPLETNEVDTCTICLDAKLKSTFVSGQHCDCKLCSDCFAMLEKCPFCRAEYE